MPERRAEGGDRRRRLWRPARRPRRCARAPADVTLIDRQNHHCFQPLLYQVATAALSPADMAWPIRHILREQRNATVLMEEVTASIWRQQAAAHQFRRRGLRLSGDRDRRDARLFRP